jgi:hypothetical protein
MDADAVNIQRGENQVKRPEDEEIAKRWQWLIKQVAPSLKEAIKTERKQGRGDARFYEFLLASGLREDMLKAAFAYSQFEQHNKDNERELDRKLKLR